MAKWLVLLIADHKAHVQILLEEEFIIFVFMTKVKFGERFLTSLNTSQY